MKIYRNNNIIHNIEIGLETVFTQKLMGEHIVSTQFYAVEPLDLQLGDYIIHKNEKYYINQVPDFNKINNFDYMYSFNFESEIYFLLNKKLLHLGDFDFTYFGSPQEHLQLLIDNVNTIVTGWQLGTVDVVDGKLLSYSNISCKDALSLIASEFELEYKIVGRTIHLMANVGTTTTHSFSYGRGNGLYNIARNVVNDANVVTRMYGFGGSKNIDTDYRDGTKKLVFEDRYLEKNTELYGIIEGVFEDAEIFPQRTSTVTSTDSELEIYDTTLDFNINDQLMSGVTAQIVFKSGALGGNTFDIDNYNNTTKKITLIANVDENDYTLPNETVKATLGDEYTIVGVTMPQTYTDAVEAELLAETQASLDKNCIPQVIYNVKADKKYFKENAVDLSAGDFVNIKDEALGIDINQRVAKIQYPILDEYKVTLTIAESIPYNFQTATRAALDDHKVYTKEVDKRSIENTRKMAINQRDLKNQIFDTDGYFDTENIKPLSIETGMLSVGQVSQDFNLLEVSIQTNITDANDLQISAGQLVHNAIEIAGLGYVWDLPLFNISTLISANSYYVYAKCSKTSLTGTWYVSSSQKKVEDEPGYYLFLLGVLYPVQDNKRDFYFTKGMTYIVGDTIKTGRIQSTDGLTFIDLDSGSYRVGNGTSYLDWNNEEANVLKVNNAKITNATIENSSIENLTVSNGSNLGDWSIIGGLIVSDDTANPAIELDAQAGQIRLNDASGRVSLINGNGVLSNAGNTQVLPGTSGVTAKASVAGLGFGDVDKDLGHSNNFLAGVYGTHNNTGDAPSYGGYFKDLYVGGLTISTKVTTATSYTIERSTVNLYCYNTSDMDVFLPLNPLVGQTHFVKRIVATGGVTIEGLGGIDIWARTGTSAYGLGHGKEAKLTYDGTYWQLSRLEEGN